MQTSPGTSFATIIAALAMGSASAAQAQSALEEGFYGALRGCEVWILDPGSWIDGPAPFIAAVGLGETMGRVSEVDEGSLPPPALRRANHYWRINSTDTVGYVLVVSDQTPMCHITGGGNVDLQPAVEAVLRPENFVSRWETTQQTTRHDVTTTRFRNRANPALSIVISRPSRSGERLDRVQVLATATYEMES